MALLSAEDVEGAPPWVCDEFAKLRFTRARPGKPEQAVELYKEMLAWREAFGTDSLGARPVIRCWWFGAVVLSCWMLVTSDLVERQM